MKADTVNVIEVVDNSVVALHAFSDNEEGNKEAEAIFVTIVKENGDDVSEAEMEVFLEDGYFEQGSYQTFLVHSN